MKRVVIEDIAHGGAGIAKINGKVVFVEKALPNEVVDIEIIDDKKDFCNAEIVEIIEPSSKRVDCVCPYCGICGGCDFQHIKYDYQLKLKRSVLERVLNRIGKFDIVADDIKIVASRLAFNYRRRIKFKCKDDRWGFFKRKSSRVVEIDKCYIVDEKINRYISKNICNNREVVLSDDGKINADVMALDLSEIINGLYLTYKYGAFIQVNRHINLAIIKTIIDEIKKKGIESALDFFCGIGNLSLPLAFLGLSVVGFDSNKKAVDSFNKNAKRLKLIGNAKAFKKNLSRKFLFDWSAKSPRCIILDPPRAGAKHIVEYIIKSKPEYLFYLSCEPSTLARDLRNLKDYYIIDKVTLFDMFPQTHHFETLVGLKLR